MATLKSALASVTGINNAKFWDMARRFSPDFKSHTSERTLADFNEKGFEEIKLTGTNVLNEFIEVSMRVAFQMMNVSRAKNPLIDKGLVQVYSTPNGGYVQRMAVNSIKPVSPAYLDLVDGGTVDPFIIRKPEVDERFFQMNFNYQSLVTIQEYQVKTMFINEYGMGELIAGILQGLANGYTVQENVNTKACMNQALNSTTFPLKDTQVINLSSWTAASPTDDELKELILCVKDVATSFDTLSITGMYNAKGFESALDSEDMILVMRAGIKNRIALNLRLGAYNPEYLSLPFESIEIDNFGGIEHYSDEAYTTPVYPVYDKLGAQIGWSTTEGSDTAELSDDEVYKKDPNEGVLAMLVQKGAFFENAQNPYTVEPIRNPRGLYTNYIANRPNNGINWDALYNLVVFRAPEA